MRIPLDYYRILGVPIQATAEQLQQAYRDRALQLPRREYSEVTITARKQLLDEAYGVLSDPEKRSEYDASFLAKNYELESEQQAAPIEATSQLDTDESYTPSIEIQSEQFVGALLILQELGEYELVLKLGRPYLSTSSVSIERGRLGSPQLVRADIVLTVALACLELGREQWQQGQYENAAISLETGQELLLRESVFASVRGEIQADLYKLRPYRILELLALPEENFAERRQGLQLLQDMLQERGGIDGTGDDQSGLNIDDFLRFIQQLRGYLTSAEQQVLFEAEARRPSAVATYLAVYALLARGFGHKQPALIRQAKLMLMRLGRRQDVHLEQAVCALLLGQTEEASRALELSQEYEPLAFIREHSQGAPDLLPGLCLYGERWLQTEVFPHFRDLKDQRVALKDFFADEQVQAYLEELPAEEEIIHDSTVWQTEQVAYAAAPSQTVNEASGFRRPASVAWNSPSQSAASESRTHEVSAAVSRTSSKSAVEGEPVAATVTRSTTMTATIERPAAASVSTLPSAERVAKTVTETERSDLGGDSSSKRQRRQRLREQSRAAGGSRSDKGDSAGKTVSSAGDVIRRSSGIQRYTAKARSAKQGRLLLLVLAGVLGVGAVVMLLLVTYGWLQKALQGFSTPVLQGEQAMVQLEQPVVPLPEPNTPLFYPAGVLTPETAQQVVEMWLSRKAAALGSDYKLDQLPKILAEPALSRWQRNAQTAKRSNSYWQYKHGVEVKGVETSEATPDKARVDAQVAETAELYTEGQLNKERSYDETLQVRYDLVRQEGQWLIRDMTVLK